MQFVGEEARVNKLVREERFVLVRENGLQLDGPSRGVDLVIQRFQSSGGEFPALPAIEGVHDQLSSRPNLLQNVRQKVFRDIEDDRDGLQLRDHDQGIRIVGVNNVTHID